MTRAAELSSINCTSCGAGLSVLGGGRVNSHVCGYCGAVLDAQDNYQVLKKVEQRDSPASPVRIGDSITVDGVDFTVIGTIGMHEGWSGSYERWTEHQLYSPTHGYAWLSVEKGHFLYSRKRRDQAAPGWISRREVEEAETPPQAHFRGQRYRYFESGSKEIDFMEGEFNWLPEMGEKTNYVTLMSDDAMLTFAARQTEREVEQTVMLDHAEVARQLDRPVDPPHGRHPLAPYRPFAHEGFMTRTLAAFAAAALALAFLFSIMDGRLVLNEAAISIDTLPQTYGFEVTTTAQPLEVIMESDVQNGAAVFEARITGPDGQPVASGARASEFYSGVDRGERWSEGSRRTSFRIRPQATGTHQLTLGLGEVQTWRGSGTPLTRASLFVREGRPTALYLLIAGGIFGLGALFFVGRKSLHSRRRWSMGDWTDED